MHDTILFYPPPHPHCSHYCTTIARLLRNIRPPSDSPRVYYTTYHIGQSNIVKRARCTVQLLRFPVFGGRLCLRRYLLLSLTESAVLSIVELNRFDHRQPTDTLSGVYTILLFPILYNVWHTKGRSEGGGRIWPISRAIALQQCGQCKWGRARKGGLIRAQKPRSKEYLVKANTLFLVVRRATVNAGSSLQLLRLPGCSCCLCPRWYPWLSWTLQPWNHAHLRLHALLGNGAPVPVRTTIIIVKLA